MFGASNYGKILLMAVALMLITGAHPINSEPEVDDMTTADRGVTIVDTVDDRHEEEVADAEEEIEEEATEEKREEEPEQELTQEPEPQEKAVQAINDLALPAFNQYVLKIINTYQGRSYPYLLNNDYQNYNGVTTTLEYQGQVLARAHPSGNRASHCSGITFEVFFKAMQQRNKDLGLDPNNFNGLSYKQLQDFLLTWYVASGNKANSNIAVAVERYGLGRRIDNLEDALPGDFVDFSRENGTGHTVVLMDWIRDAQGRIIGIHYWSSQQSTNGIAYRKEYFNVRNASGNKYGKVRTDMVYIARVQA
ncbi:hypothetical protein [Desulfofalx alkaliphila]|uniref:hypothetical protein n=1 Tax=Desulfofalx alkaliphila TaxID=105483 RepID=UPI0004E26A88|nr:hypothetical protein [Desulfofalx alkaliphila]